MKIQSSMLSPLILNHEKDDVVRDRQNVRPYEYVCESVYPDVDEVSDETITSFFFSLLR